MLRLPHDPDIDMREIAKQQQAGRLWQRVACSTLLCAASGLVSAAETPGADHYPGKFVFAELVTPDLAGAKQFYGSLFGWAFRDVQVGAERYAEASLDHRPIAGMVYRAIGAGERRQPAWLSFIAVGDVDAAQKTVVARGARSLSPPHDVAGLGRIAVFADPEGAVFGVLASSAGDPPEELAAPGEWIWHSLFTTDPDAAAAFYQTLFDYEVFDLPEENDDQHLVLASGGYARASANSLPLKRTHAHWLNYVRVDDAASTSARVVALGGRVLVAPRDDRHGGRVAVVADPQGAPFGLLEWTDAENRKVAP